MKLKVLHSPLDKGETWAEKDSRIIAVVESSDNRGTKPSVCFGIFKQSGKQQKITEDFFFEPKTAIKIAKEMIRVANKIEKDWKDRKK